MCGQSRTPKTLTPGRSSEIPDGTGRRIKSTLDVRSSESFTCYTQINGPTLILPSFTGVDQDQLAIFDTSEHNYASSGTDGPVQLTVPMAHTKLERMFFGAMKDLGVDAAKDAYGGDVSTLRHGPRLS